VPAAVTGVTTTCVASGGALCPTSIAAGNSINLVVPVLTSASSIELLVNGTAPSTAQALVNTATVAPPAGITDPIPGNNSSTANTTVTLAAPTTADLAVVKTGPSTVASGGRVSYTVTVVNNGPGSANGAVFADPLPSVLTNATATCTATNGAVCGAVAVSSNNVSSAITTLPAGGVVTFNIIATAPVSGSFSNTATITPPTGVSDPNTTNNVSGAVITQIQTTGIAGVVWRDANRNSTLDAGEQLLSGVTVTVRNSAGVAVGTTQTDAKGAYSIVGLIPGSGYSVNFDFGNLDRGLVIPQNTNASLNGTATNQTTISNVTLTAGVVTLDQNARVVDPGGVVYDSVTRLPIAGATVTLLGPNGQAVPASQLLATTPNNQITPATGSYEFLLNGTAPTGTYTLQVTPPAGYGPPNAVNGGVAQPTPRDVPPAPGTLLVQPQTAPPAVGASTVYHFVLNNLGPSSQDVLNNHIPLDSRVAGNLLINKIAATSVAEVGDSVKYTIRINNTNNFILSGAVVRDTASAGFRFIAGTAKAAGVSIADPSGKAPTLSFALPPLAPNSTTELTYFMRLGVGSQQSDGVNRAQLFGSNGQVLSNLAAAKVRVTGGVLGADACIIGKVYVDCIGAVEGGNVLSSSASGDQVQRNVGGSNELGVPGVRVVMETGAYAITDSEGKYSICPVTPSTHVLRVDKRTLPKGSRMLPQSNRNAGDGTSLFADVKNGELFRADFMEGSCSTEVIDQIKARRAQGNVNAPETERPDATQFRNQNSPQPFLPKPQQILPEPRQNDGQPSKTEGK
jgi:large repetitive protein